ncbi:threonine synthase [Dehalogenimonas etheniformans]|uniref:Threonine synthase n=1 Tax=Dehalogenimonas etheniformans TaxID=1536648 RepID=A0A2P5P917_9CHLR|nr:threonine synthase [Dehalogenimonas etheniformans]PPD58784.1 threonine synthase [Dehalogenimonas etheniformans]QNT76445.1 threonine synthase [Dehalogenimonas etheniformans]
MKSGVLSHYRQYLPVTDKTPLLTLGEGETPLVRSPRLEKELGVGELYFKLESCNPTGSFKDRGMVVAVAKALESGYKAVACASTGNTSASSSAYAAAADIESIIVIPKGKIALGKLAQAIVYGAKIIMVDGNFDDALRLVRELTEKQPVALVNSVNPNRIQGQKTAAFEVCDVLGKAPDLLFLPVGNAGNITAYWKGFKEYRAQGIISSVPRMMGFQAAGAAPIVLGHPVEKPETIATAIRIGNPASWKQAEAARDESHGNIDSVADQEILEAYHIMAEKGGIFGEPASAASLAGLIKMSRMGFDFSSRTAVCVVTGSGLKDADTAIKGFSGKFIEIPAELRALEKALGF